MDLDFGFVWCGFDLVQFGVLGFGCCLVRLALVWSGVWVGLLWVMFGLALSLVCFSLAWFRFGCSRSVVSLRFFPFRSVPFHTVL